MNLIVNAYDNMKYKQFDFMDEIEQVSDGLRNTREKLNIKHTGNLTNVEKNMDEWSNFVSNSGRINMSNLSQLSARSSFDYMAS